MNMTSEADIQQKLHKILQAILKRDPGQLRPEMPWSEVPGWSSLTFIRMLVMAGKELDVKFAASEYVTVKTIGEFVKKVQEKLEKR